MIVLDSWALLAYLKDEDHADRIESAWLGEGATICSAMAIEAFAERAARELAASGETARKRDIDTSGELTAREAQIARLARDGLSNAEIGARLFISPWTVEYHLSKVFIKLAIGARHELERALPKESSAVIDGRRAGSAR